MSEPILITGTFRSGTTLISQIMRNHSDIELVYDSVNFMRFSYDRYNPLNDFNNVKKLLNEVWNRIKKRWDMEFDYKKVVSRLKEKELNYTVIYDSIMSNLLLKNSDASIWGEKTTLVWTKVPDFFQMFPNGRVIHIVRDPRAVLASWKKMTHTPGYDYLDAILNCRGSMEKALEYQKKYKNKRYYMIYFEDLVNNSQETTKKLCDSIDIDYEKNMLNTSSFTNKKGESWNGNSMFENKIKGFSNKTIDKWKQELEKWEIGLNKYLTKDLMKKFRYNLSEIKIDEERLEIIIDKIKSSDLVIDGLLKYLFTGNGHERFPEDPLNPKNWDSGENQ